MRGAYSLPLLPICYPASPALGNKELYTKHTAVAEEGAGYVNTLFMIHLFIHRALTLAVLNEVNTNRNSRERRKWGTQFKNEKRTRKTENGEGNILEIK